MSNKQNHPASHEASVNSTPSRRRFVRGVGLATPVVLTLASRSALAQTCLSPSAQASIALDNSRPNRDQTSCTGRSPGFWGQAANPDQPNHSFWVASGAEGVLFSTIVGDPMAFPGKTLKDVLQNGNAGKGKGKSKDDFGGSSSFSDPDELGAHLSAAWCNLQTAKVPTTVLSLEDIQQMWRDHWNGYKPVPGVVWYGGQIVTFIMSTFWG